MTSAAVRSVVVDSLFIVAPIVLLWFVYSYFIAVQYLVLFLVAGKERAG